MGYDPLLAFLCCSVTACHFDLSFDHRKKTPLRSICDFLGSLARPSNSNLAIYPCLPLGRACSQCELCAVRRIAFRGPGNDHCGIHFATRPF